MTILTHALPSWPIEDYHEGRDRGKTWVALDGLLFVALQDTIDRTQRGNRLNPLLLEALHHRRLRIEHVHSSVKRCRVVKDRIRLWKDGVRDLVMELCCALHNFRVRLTPWQPMV